MTHRRRGASLIELTVTVGLLSVVMTLVIKTMAVLMRTERTGQKAVVASGSLTRLANRFRRDVHAAEKAELVAAAAPNTDSFLRLTHPDGTIVEYRPAADGVKLTILRDGTATGRETYRLRGDTRFELSEEPPPVVTLIHVPDHGRIPDSKAGAKNDKQIRVEAVRGFDLRYTVRKQRIEKQKN
jgi:type II secretory pathway component PulJ